MNSWQEIVVVVLVVAALGYVVRSIVRSLMGGRGCGCRNGCGVTSPPLVEIQSRSKKRETADDSRGTAGG
jgi:hypothetical protein